MFRKIPVNCGSVQKDDTIESFKPECLDVTRVIQKAINAMAEEKQAPASASQWAAGSTICRALELLKDGGHLGFITPMAVLGDKIAVEMRRKIVEVGSFTRIEAFPQKDNPARRVFPEAKLSTAIFIVKKGTTSDDKSRLFSSREFIPRDGSKKIRRRSS